MQIKPVRGSDMRQLNERIVLNLFYDLEMISQSDVVSMTGLKPSTVLRIFLNLERDGEICMIDPETTDTKRNVVGRHPVYYKINPAAHYSVGLTFSKDVIELVILDFALNIVHSARAAFSFSDTSHSLAENIASFVREALSDAHVDPDSVLGIGVGCPGNVDPDRGTLLSFTSAPNIQNYPLREKLEALLKSRVFVQGINLLAAQYYNRYSDLDARDRILYVSIDSAVTGSFYSRTPGGMLGGVPSLPIGWMLLQRPDSIINMHDVLTLNNICSEESILTAMKPFGIESMDALEAALEAPPPQLEQAVQNMSDALSYCVSNLSMLFQPQAIIFASHSKRFSQLLASTVSHLLDSRYFWPFEQEPVILGRTHNFRKISRSAVDLVLDNEFNANLGWKRPKVLSQPQHEEGWHHHFID